MALFTLEMPIRDERLYTLSRDMTRILRHGPNQDKGESPVDMDMRDGSIAVLDFLKHPTIRMSSASEEDMRRVAQDISPGVKCAWTCFSVRDTEYAPLMAIL